MIDQIIVLAYLAIVLLIGLWSGRYTVTLQDYAIGKRNFSNPVLVAGIAATMIAASGTSGLTGKIYSIGLISILSYMGVVASRMLLAFVVAPRMGKFLGLISSGDIFEKLYGKEARILIGFLTLIEGPLLAGAQILATYQACQIFFGISKELAAVVTTVVTIAYCFRGGIRAVTATDVFQFIIMIVAIPILATICINKIGGINEFISGLNQKQLLWDSVINGDKFKHIIIFVSIAITCVFPLTIQRMLMAKSIHQIQRTFFANGLVTLFFYLSLGVIGLSAALLLPNIDPNFALPILINEILPPAVRGLLIAGLIAIFMSSSDSDMNITAIALTQDFLKPMLGKNLTEKMAFFITKASFVFTGLLALMVALYYSNALDVMFLLMTISNSIYFPGMFFGIIGLVPSKKGFWLGAVAGALTISIMCFWLKIFPLYAMMSAIFLNSGVILTSIFIAKFNRKWIRSIFTSIYDYNLSKNETFFEFKKSNYLVSASSYGDVFSVTVLLNSLAPFFLGTIYQNQQPIFLAILNITSSVLAALLLLRQTFNKTLSQLTPAIWHITVFLALTLSSAISITQSKFSLITLFDSAAVFALLILLLEKRHLWAHIIMFSMVTAGLIYFESSSIINADIYYWSIFLHSTALGICLVLFRKREVAAYKFMSLKFVHEAGRTVSAVSTSASLLQRWLPTLVEAYCSQQTNKGQQDRDLSMLLDIPKQLKDTSHRTWENLDRMLAWMEISKNQKTYSMHSIRSCIQSAIQDSSISNEIRERIKCDDMADFLFFGDDMQVSNVILNLLENAGHAIKNRQNSSITIWTENNTLFIKDTGSGITKANLPNIFDEFFSTKGTSGQGLAFCKFVMHQHNGTIACESELGEYTLFKLDFPLTLNNEATKHEKYITGTV